MPSPKGCFFTCSEVKMEKKFYLTGMFRGWRDGLVGKVLDLLAADPIV